MAPRQFPRTQLVDWLSKTGEGVLLAFDDGGLTLTPGFSPEFTLRYLFGFSCYNSAMEAGLKKGKRAASVFRKQARNLRNVRVALDSVIGDTRAAILFDNLKSVADRTGRSELLSEANAQQFSKAVSQLDKLAAMCDAFGDLYGSQSDRRLPEAMKTRYLVALHAHLKAIEVKQPYRALSSLLKSAGHHIKPDVLRNRLNEFEARDPLNTSKYRGAGEGAASDDMPSELDCFDRDKFKAEQLADQIISAFTSP